jgi:hypothetical protein
MFIGGNTEWTESGNSTTNRRDGTRYNSSCTLNKRHNASCTNIKASTLSRHRKTVTRFVCEGDEGRLSHATERRATNKRCVRRSYTRHWASCTNTNGVDRHETISHQYEGRRSNLGRSNRDSTREKCVVQSRTRRTDSDQTQQNRREESDVLQKSSVIIEVSEL